MNYEYEKNIQSLVILQKWFKKCILSRKLSLIIPRLIPIYYHPDCHGGFMAKKKIMKLCNSINLIE